MTGTEKAKQIQTTIRLNGSGRTREEDKICQTKSL